jgi:hypothetical protein
VKKLRWWSAVILIVALVPMVVLYFVWLPLTAVGWVKAADIEENNHIPVMPCLSCCVNKPDEKSRAPPTTL